MVSALSWSSTDVQTYTTAVLYVCIGFIQFPVELSWSNGPFVPFELRINRPVELEGVNCWIRILRLRRIKHQIVLYCPSAIISPKVGCTMNQSFPISSYCQLQCQSSSPRFDIVQLRNSLSSSSSLSWCCSLDKVLLRVLISLQCVRIRITSVFWLLPWGLILIQLCPVPKTTTYIRTQLPFCQSRRPILDRIQIASAWCYTLFGKTCATTQKKT